MSPVVFVSKSIQFRIHTRNEHNPPHVHAVRGDAEAVVGILTGEVAFSKGFSRSDLKRIVAEVLHRRQELMKTWSEFYEQD